MWHMNGRLRAHGGGSGFRARARLRSRIGPGYAGDIAVQSLVAAAASDVADRRP